MLNELMNEEQHKKIIGKGLEKVPADKILQTAVTLYGNYSQQNTINFAMESLMLGMQNKPKAR
tara:strand:+ start:1412 stop:1600 length:189 start_codon:yes stop_codon:yes gene_type:complete